MNDEPDLFDTEGDDALDDERYREALRTRTALSGFEQSEGWEKILSMLRDVEQHCLTILTVSDTDPTVDPIKDYIAKEKAKVKLQTVRILIESPVALRQQAEEVIQLYRSYQNAERKEEG